MWARNPGKIAVLDKFRDEGSPRRPYFSGMKNCVFVFWLLALCPAAWSQPDLDFGEEYEPPLERALDRLAPVFGTNQATRFAVKWNALALLPPSERTQEGPTGWRGMYGGQTPFSLSIEGKFAPAFSLVGTVGAARLQRSFDGGYYFRPHFVWEQRVEPRFYFEMLRRAANGKQADNLSANYVSLEYRHRTESSLLADGFNFPTEFSKHTFTARIGLQRRFFGRGWFDASLGIGRTRRIFHSFPDMVTTDEGRTVLDPRLSAGLLLGDFRPKKVGKSIRCTVFGCDEERYTFGKFDLFGLLVPQQGGARGRLSLAFEMKMGRAPLSLELEGLVPYSVVREEFTPNQFYSDGYFGAGGGLEPRLFLGKKRQNLNGLFLGWNFQSIWFWAGERQMHSTPVVGLQSRIFRNGFVSYKFGVGRSWLRVCVDDFWFGPQCFDVRQQHLLSEFKAGLAF